MTIQYHWQLAVHCSDARRACAAGEGHASQCEYSCSDVRSMLRSCFAEPDDRSYPDTYACQWHRMSLASIVVSNLSRLLA